MGASACPDCTTINNDKRTMCRTCHAPLKPYDTPSAKGTGRITFATTQAIELPTATSIPVLFDGKPVGINVAVMMGENPAQFKDARAAVIGALSRRPHRPYRKV